MKWWVLSLKIIISIWISALYIFHSVNLGRAIKTRNTQKGLHMTDKSHWSSEHEKWSFYVTNYILYILHVLHNLSFCPCPAALAQMAGSWNCESKVEGLVPGQEYPGLVHLANFTSRQMHQYLSYLTSRQMHQYLSYLTSGQMHQYLSYFTLLCSTSRQMHQYLSFFTLLGEERVSKNETQATTVYSPLNMFSRLWERDFKNLFQFPFSARATGYYRYMGYQLQMDIWVWKQNSCATGQYSDILSSVKLACWPMCKVL